MHHHTHTQDNTYHDICYTSHGALAGTRNCLMGPQWGIDPMTYRIMSKSSYHGSTSRSLILIDSSNHGTPILKATIQENVKTQKQNLDYLATDSLYSIKYPAGDDTKLLSPDIFLIFSCNIVHLGTKNTTIFNDNKITSNILWNIKFSFVF